MTALANQMAFAVLCSDDEAGLEALLNALRVPMRQVIVVSRQSLASLEAVCERLSVRCLSGVGPGLDARGVNAGAVLAAEIGADILCVIRSQVRFQTQVVSEAVAVLNRRPWLGVVAPAAVLIDGSLQGYTIAHRASWHLGEMRFFRETLAPELERQWYDADFCELTCAFLRLSAFAEVGPCDAEYDSVVAAVDLCFRLQKAGYGCASLPSSQVELVANFDLMGPITPGFSADLARFSDRHLLATFPHPHTVESQERFAGAEETFARYGLGARGGLAPAVTPMTSLATVPDRPNRSPTTPDRRTISSFIVPRIEVLAPNTSRGACVAIDPGIDTDVFHAWGRGRQNADSCRFLAIVDGWQTEALTATMQAWRRCRITMPGASLRLLGRGLVAAINSPADATIRRGRCNIARYRGEDFEVQDFVTALDPRVLAELLRSADVVLIPASASSVPTAEVLQAEACGAQVVLVDVLSADRSVGGSSFWSYDDETLAAQMTIAWEHRFVLDRDPAGRDPADWIKDHTWRRRMASLRAFLASDQSASRAIAEQASRGSRFASVASNDGPPIIPEVTHANPPAMPATLVRRLGQSIAGFGTTWEDIGFVPACRLAAARIALSVRYRVAHLHAVETWRAGKRRKLQAPICRPLLVGYINGKLGLGESLRGLARSLIAVDCPFDIHPFSFGIEDRQLPPVFSDRYDVSHPHTINVIEVSANELPYVLRELDQQRLGRSYNIFRAWWELERAPEAWRDVLLGIDEIWAPNDFVAQAFRPIFEGPITIVPPCVSVPVGPEAPRDPDQPFTFLFSFDFHSSPQRKNPVGVIRAFQDAFANPDLPVRLIIKSTSAPERHADLRDALHQAVAADPRIVIRDEHLSREAMLELLRHADCYVSLHRSEGFGLGMAEAMSLGRPVIGTAYSGNTDFLTEQTGYPVGYDLRPLVPGEYVHGEGQRWAEPNHKEAIAAMRDVFLDRGEASYRAQAGRHFILKSYAPEQVGHIVSGRLTELGMGT